ncbi:hypothetical protein T492DRAFT_883286 [Pavlovales sp. CCMP2436]|nr:hypothetical protein T492DRAFT_883286 [Pavlovales sp. CCMP2436]
MYGTLLHPPAVPLQHAESRDSDEATVPGDAVDLEQQLRSTDPEYDDEERRFPFDTSSVEDVASTLFTCANWVLQVVVVVYLNESAEMGAGNYTWVSTFVAAPLAANIVAVICWLLYSPAKGFLRKLESEPDVQDEDRAIVRTLGLISNFLADIPFFAIELNLILSGSRSPLLVAIPYALAFWLVSLFFTAMLSTQPLFEPRLAPGLESLGAEW